MERLQVTLNWAHHVGLMNEVPKIAMPKRAKRSKKMKGRPVSGEEFERMLAKVDRGLVAVVKKRPKGEKRQRRRRPPVIPVEVVESWKHYLRGLWWSGLRLDESLQLYWDRSDRLFVYLIGKYPMLHIPAELERGNQDRLHPIAPEFAEFLLATPDVKRTGRVFKPLPNCRIHRSRRHRVSARLSRPLARLPA